MSTSPEMLSSGWMLAATTLNTGGTATVTSSAYSNTSGASWIAFIVQLGAIASTGTLSVLKLQHATASGGTYADVTGGDVVADGGLVIADTDDNKNVLILVRTHGLRPHFKIVATTATAANTVVNGITAVAWGGKSGNPPSYGGALFTHKVG